MKSRLPLLSVLSLAVLALFVPAYAWGQCTPTTYTVTNANDDGSSGELRWAVTQAEACPGSTINFSLASPSTITLTSRILINAPMTINGPGTSSLTISGGQPPSNGTANPSNTRIFFVDPGTGSTVSISNLTLANGVGFGGYSCVGGGAAGMGGAIFQNSGTLNVTGVVFNGNYAAGGPSGIQCSFSSGYVGTGGGGFGGNAPGAFASNAEFGGPGGDLGGAGGTWSNGGSGGNGGPGGGGGASGCGSCSGGNGGFAGGGGDGAICSTCNGGNGGFGGGGAATGGAPVGNGGFGGGNGGVNSPGAASVPGGGGAGFGGAIFVNNGNLALNNDQFVNNGTIEGAVEGTATADQTGQAKGGALFIMSTANATATGVTFSGSTAEDAGRNSTNPYGIAGAYQNNLTCPGQDTVDVCGILLPPDSVQIVSGNNQSGATTRTLAQPFVAQTNDSSQITFTIVSDSGAGGAFPGGASSVTVGTDSNGNAISPQLIANNTPGSFTVTATDGFGTATTFTVVTTGCTTNPEVNSTTADSLSNPAQGTLRWAVNNACAGSTITFASGLTSPIALTPDNFNGRLRIDDSLNIQGPGAGSLAIDGGGATRLFFIGGGTVSISGLTLQNGLAQGGGANNLGGGAAGMGGAIFQSGGMLTVNGVNFTGNAAVGGAANNSLGGQGGGGFGGSSHSYNGGSGGDLFGLAGVNGGYNGGSGAGGGAGPTGGSGGFGGGGGYEYSALPGTSGGTGGFGGGGGAALSIAGSAAPGSGGFGGGAGSVFEGGGGGPFGGGGAGFGGAIFEYAGTLALLNDSFTNNSAIGGVGYQSGQGKGGALFIYSGAGAGYSNLTFGTGGTANVAAAAGSPGIGNSASPYTGGATCPGQDTVDICGTLTLNASSAIAVSSSQNPSAYGQAVSFTATVTPVAPATGTPTGTVQFAIDGSNFGSPVTLSSGTATSGNISTLSAAYHTVTATYSGDSNFGNSSGTLTGGLIVNLATSSVSVSLTAGTDPSVYGQSVTFTAMVSGEYGTNVSGTVAWSGNTGCAPSPLSGNPGMATCTTSSLPVGASDTVTATYGGDGDHSGSSGSVNQTVNPSGTQAGSATTVGSSQNPSNFGQAVSFTANVTPASGGGTPTGTVQFAIDGTNFGSPATLSSGMATSGSTSTLSIGNHTVTATYSGDSNFAGSSGTLTGGQTVADTQDLQIVSGNNQGGATTRTLGLPFILQTAGNPIAGNPITFTVVPSNGAGGTFPGGLASVAVATDANGYATSPQLIVNGTPGSFTVTGSDGSTAVSFNVVTTQCVAPSVTNTNETGNGSLRYAVDNACVGSNIDLTSLSGTIPLFSRLRIDDSLTITGPAASRLAINGQFLTRIFFIGGGTVSISGLTLENGLGLGGYSSFGGNAAGLGGAIFMNGGAVTLVGVTLSGNNAQGGSTSGSGFGGGGYGGPPTGPAGYTGGPGGDLFGIGGTGNLSYGPGGPGGPGAGGGVKGGTGGFGGGGAVGGNGGFGGGGGQNGVGGFGGGSGNGNTYGGGGAGFGGAIFEYAGTLTLINDMFTGNSASGGSSYGGNNGQAKGGALFIYNGATAINNGSTFAGDLAADAGAPGIGNSAVPYTNGATCPGQDTPDICGTFTLQPTVSFTGPASAVYGTTFTVTATTNSGATATISVTGGSCQVSGTSVTMTSGTVACQLLATWPPNPPYSGATASLSVAATPAATVLTVTGVSTPAEAYGSRAHTTVAVILAWAANQLAAPTGGLTFGSTASGSFLGSPNCAARSGASIRCTQVFAPAIDAPGTYTISASYAGDGNYAASSSTQTNNFSITQQTPTVNVTSVAPASEPYGSGTVVAVTGSLGWTGSGTGPTSSNGPRLTFSSTAAGRFGSVTCQGPKPVVCQVNFTPAATDAAGSYTFNASYSGDTNYTAAQSNSTANLVITPDAPAASVTPNPVTVSVGSTAAVKLTATFTGAGARDAAPVGSVQFNAASGAFSGQSCSTSKDVLTCTVNYTPSGTLAVGTYGNYITASIAAGGDYQASSGSANLTVTR